MKGSCYILFYKKQRTSRIMKRCLIGFIVLIVILAAAIWSQWDKGGVPVLNYHQINDEDFDCMTVSTENFDRQMRYLSENGYHAITPDELADWLENGTPLPAKPVVITLDDGYLDNYENAFPILKKYDMKATIFIISDFVGTYPNYLTWDTIDEMQDSGLIDFESHTLSHKELNKIDEDELYHQLNDSKHALEWRLHKKIDILAYPCGSDDQAVLDMTKEAGYRAAFTVHYGLDHPGTDMYSLDRVPVFGGVSHPLRHFALRLHLATICAPLDHVYRQLVANGHSTIAQFIPLP
jgi:peptidoglycan/xylan/chitin deacetylase (PgdA/CDA1 family)